MSTAPPDAQADHNQRQAAHFDTHADKFMGPLTADVEARLASFAKACPLPPGARVLDVGTGTGALVPHLQAAGAAYVLGVDLSPRMVELARSRFPDLGSAGNTHGARFWCGDAAALPSFQGPFQAAFFNGMFGNLLDQHDTLARVTLMVAHGGHVIISHPLGRDYVDQLKAAAPEIVPHTLPTESELRAMCADLPLKLLSIDDGSNHYLAVLQVPSLYALARAPVRMGGNVVTGFGRGSAKMGVPTANLPPDELAATLSGLSRGVYFGWAALKGEPGVHKMVMNIGKRPTFADGAGDTVEVHVMHDFGRQFYGEELRVVVVGFIRPEMRFANIGALVDRIRADVGISRNMLDAPQMASAASDPYLAFK